MKNRLQYIYSIGVLAGVLVTAYSMMSQEGNANTPFRALSGPSSYRMESAVADPALRQLMQMETSFSGLKVYRAEELRELGVASEKPKSITTKKPNQ